VRCSPSGIVSYIAMGRVKGAVKPSFQTTFGRFPEMSLADARGKAIEIITNAKRHGIDPRPKKGGAVGGVLSFGALCDAYLEKHIDRNCRPPTAKEQRRLLQRARQRWEARPAASISKDDIRELHDEVGSTRLRNYSRFDGQGATSQADNVLAAIRAAYRWAMGKGLIDADPSAGLKKGRRRERDRVLEDDELAAFWQASGELDAPYRQIFRLLLLTGQRPGEVTGMCWGELKLDDRALWTLPAERVKNGKPHLVHLSPQALAIIAELKRIYDSRVFTESITEAFLWRSQKRLQAAMAARLGREVEPWTPHDLRRSAATGMAGLGVPPHVVDKILNHVSGTISGVARIYNRHQYEAERKTALDAWGAHLAGLAGS
jgi:integrase